MADVNILNAGINLFGDGPTTNYVYMTGGRGIGDGTRVVMDRSDANLDLGLGIDCSNLTQQALLAAGYNIPYLSTNQIYANGSLTAAGAQYYHTVPLDQLQPGDLVMFQGHIGIFAGFNPQGQRLFYGSQDSTGPQRTVFSIDATEWWGRARATLTGLAPNDNTRDPTAAAAALEQIESQRRPALAQLQQLEADDQLYEDFQNSQLAIRPFTANVPLPPRRPPDLGGDDPDSFNPNELELDSLQYAPDNSLRGATFSSDSGLTAIFNATDNNRTVDLSAPNGARALYNYDNNGNVTSASGRNPDGNIWSEATNPGGDQTFTYNGQQYSGPTLASGAGLTLGSTIGGILGGNSLAGRVTGAAVIGTLGQSVGNILSRSGLGTALLGNGSFNESLFDSAVTTTVANFGGNLGVNAIGDIAGSFSSLLFGEAAQALGLHGFAGGLFTTVGTSITSQLAMNLGSMVLNEIGLTNNFVAGSFVGNIGGSIGGFFGSYLAAEIVPPTGIASSIGGRIGGAIGGFLTSEIPVIGPLFGSFVGTVLGTLVGSLFDPHIVPWSMEMVGAVNGVMNINYWNWNGGGNPNEFTALSNIVASNANQVLALTRRDPNIMNITGLTSLNELVFQQLGSTLTAIYPDGNSTNFYVNGMPSWFAAQALYNTSEIATYELVQHAVLVGSDPITTGALAAARVQDTTTPAVYADLRVAQDYERYRANAEIINTAMAANPESDFTAGWNVTLMRARALGLDRIVNYPGWTADLTDSHETVRDGNGNIVQQLTFNADGTVSTDAATLVFNFSFVGSQVSYGDDGHTYLTDPGGIRHDVTRAARLFFTDGHIDEADGNPLVETRSFPRRKRNANVRRFNRRVQPGGAKSPHTRRIHKGKRLPACG